MSDHDNPHLEVFYKKLPLVPIIILLVLIGTWLFRWDYTTTQNISNFKIVHKTDRWTGNHWLTVYGFGGGIIVSGREIPCLRNGEKAVGKQIDDIRHRRDFATKTWWVAFVGNLVYLLYGIYCLRNEN